MNRASDKETEHGASGLAPVAPEVRVGTRLAGYSIDGMLGRGGMGVVYRAKQLHLERTVALKLLAPELAQSRDFRDRFLRESRTAAAINHPSIITVYDAGESEGVLYIAMQYVDGTDLAEVLRREGALQPLRASSMLRQVADALDAAHAHGVVHRDVKPANVLIDEQRCYLTDFGLTKRISSQTALTARGQFVGTVEYMAPEQIKGAAVDARTDVYALGCLAYHSLVGSAPFQGDSEVSVVYAHLQEPPPSLMTARPDLPTGLDAVLARALAKRKEDRQPSCGELVAGLESELQSGRPRAEPRTHRQALVTILVAATEPRTRSLVRGSVKGARLHVLEAADVESALAVARKERPDLAVIDYEMPGGSAADICRTLREDSETAGIKIIAMGTMAQSDAERPVVRGVDDWIFRPFSPLQLLYKVRDLAGVELGEA